jgi:hypothetical protein
MSGTSRNPIRLEGTSGAECTCDAAKIRVVHAYLKEHFPQFCVRDFHAPSRLMHAGLPIPHNEHHVVALTRSDGLPYHAVLLSEFQEQAVGELSEQLWQGNLADTLRAHRIAIVSRSGASPL